MASLQTGRPGRCPGSGRGLGNVCETPRCDARRWPAPPRRRNQNVLDRVLPAQGQCEAADVYAVLTVAPDESFAIAISGELCSHFIDGTPTLNAYVEAEQVDYTAPTRELASATA